LRTSRLGSSPTPTRRAEDHPFLSREVNRLASLIDRLETGSWKANPNSRKGTHWNGMTSTCTLVSRTFYIDERGISGFKAATDSYLVATEANNPALLQYFCFQLSFSDFL